MITFPEGFIWGAAAASYQIEGAAGEDGKGPSIWDKFSHTPHKILNGDTGDTACDHYHKYKDDIKLMKELGLKGYRLSISWPRIFPYGKGEINQKGVDFYRFLIDELLENEIDPIITLYHWDLPQALQDIGGWGNRDVSDYFAEYASYMFKVLGGEVKKWITINEPSCISYLGYGLGDHAPGFKSYPLAVQTSHILNLAHAKTVMAYRQNNYDGEIGITLILSPVHPASDSEEDREKAVLMDGIYNRWFLDPALKGNYPEDLFKFFKKYLRAPVIKPEDMNLISENPVDFLGVNYYHRTVIKHSRLNLPFFCKEVKPEEGEYTDMGWEVYPKGIYELLTRISRDYNNPHMFITENGAAFKDIVSPDGSIDDDDRIRYLKNHFYEAHRAIADGVKLDGYYVWSLMDNFEWTYGYSKRFGLIYVDYNTLERRLKKSAKWYREVIKNNGF